MQPSVLQRQYSTDATVVQASSFAPNAVDVAAVEHDKTPLPFVVILAHTSSPVVHSVVVVSDPVELAASPL